MVARGYDVKQFNYYYDDVYFKSPFYTFEMHVKASVSPEFEKYFKNLNNRLLSVSQYEKN